MSKRVSGVWESYVPYNLEVKPFSAYCVLFFSFVYNDIYLFNYELFLEFYLWMTVEANIFLELVLINKKIINII